MGSAQAAAKDFWICPICGRFLPRPDMVLASVGQTGKSVSVDTGWACGECTSRVQAGHVHVGGPTRHAGWRG